MEEMLGVLAVIGVVTLMGLKGYQIAIVRHRANEVLNIARLILQEQESADLTGGITGIQMGNLPKGCWICSYKSDATKLVIGDCEPKVMDAIGNIL